MEGRYYKLHTFGSPLSFKHITENIYQNEVKVHSWKCLYKEDTSTQSYVLKNVTQPTTMAAPVL